MSNKFKLKVRPKIFSRFYAARKKTKQKTLFPDQDRHSVGPDWVQTVCKSYQR